MLPALTFQGRLPGVLCQSALPPAGGAPLRLDVAAFVGFAERGPLDAPVAVEDPGQYQAVFGGDLAVARRGGQPAYAQLPGAVQMFFDNGGRRCYVVRVAGDGAYPNRFRLPGVVAWDSGTATVADVVLSAAWVGRWSDGLRIGTQLSSRPLQVTAAFGPPDRRDEVALQVETPAPGTVRPGDVVRLGFGLAEPYYDVMLPVAATSVRGPAAATTRGVPVTLRAPAGRLVALPASESGSPPAAPLAVYQRSSGGWVEALPLGPCLRADLLRFSLVVQDGDDVAERWDDLQFNPGANSWIAKLARRGDRGEAAEASAYLTLSTRLRAPGSDASRVYLPWGMDAWLDPDRYARPLADPPAGSPPTESISAKDGLDEYDPAALFLDERLRGATLYSLLTEANAIMYLAEPTLPSASGEDDGDGPLAGSSIAPGQRLRGIHGLIPVDEVALIAVPDALHAGWPGEPAPELLPPEPVPPPAPERDWSHFDDCQPPEGPPPVALGLPDIAPCPGPRLSPISSDPTDIRTQLLHLPTTITPAQYRPDRLLEVQTALVTLCAARADILGVLGLPEAFETRQALDWQKQIIGRLGTAGASLSYAAAYHPWLHVRETHTPELSPLRALAPDGTICGLIAARERSRGPWIAPANDPLRGVVGLTPALEPTDWESLFNAQLNLVRHLPGQFTCLSAHTLGQDRQLLQISVRRLLIYLRKLALRRGMQYVFETNNERFRQRVQGAFEATLRAIVDRGGLTAFQVVTDESINTPNDRDNGRFLIALKVAPTLPIEFITVVLLRAGEGLLDTQEVGRG